MDSQTKLCPYCSEEIKSTAIKCKHCGSMLSDAPPSSGSIGGITLVRQALASRYEIIEEIGRGGMATVYLAVQKNLQRAVALKVIHQNLVHDSEFVARFHREAQVCASLQHPNIVTVYDEGEVSGVHFMAMELIDGLDLHHIIRQQGKIDVKQTLAWTAPIALAIEYAHNRGIIHRDIKSSNILVSNNGHPVLMDFGIAHAATGTRLTQTGLVIGTPEYMSPEQAEGKTIDHRTDIYSLGIVMYECLTGHVPFKADNPLSIIMKVVNEAPVPPVNVNKQIPPGLNDAILKAINKKPEDRFSMAAHLFEALNKPLNMIDGVIVDVFDRIESDNQEPDSSQKKKSSSNIIIKVIASFLAIAFLSLGSFYLHERVSDSIYNKINRNITILNNFFLDKGLVFSVYNIKPEPLKGILTLWDFKIETTDNTPIFSSSYVEIKYNLVDIMKVLKYDSGKPIDFFELIFNNAILTIDLNAGERISLGKIFFKSTGSLSLGYFDNPNYLPDSEQNIFIDLSKIEIISPGLLNEISKVMYQEYLYENITKFNDLVIKLDYFPIDSRVIFSAELTNDLFLLKNKLNTSLTASDIKTMFEGSEYLPFANLVCEGKIEIGDQSKGINRLTIGDLGKDVLFSLNSAYIDYSVNVNNFNHFVNDGINSGYSAIVSSSIDGFKVQFSDQMFDVFREEIQLPLSLQVIDAQSVDLIYSYDRNVLNENHAVKKFNAYTRFANIMIQGIIARDSYPKENIDLVIDLKDVKNDLKPFIAFFHESISNEEIVRFSGNPNNFQHCQLRILGDNGIIKYSFNYD
jgi:serine/threonine protein kinase